VEAKYGNLFEMYQRITGEDPYTTPMRIYPAVHYTMGGLWVDYDLQSTIPGLFVIGEANFSDHGANRLGASALMQGLADGYFVLPNTIGDYLAAGPFEKLTGEHPEVAAARHQVEDRITRILAINGDRTVDSFHRELGRIMWEYCGMERTDEGLHKAIALIRDLKDEFWRRVKVPGSGRRDVGTTHGPAVGGQQIDSRRDVGTTHGPAVGGQQIDSRRDVGTTHGPAVGGQHDIEGLNQSLEKAGRVADFFELAELMCIDALHRTESCGGHFRAESQDADGEALRDDENFSYVAAWEWGGDEQPVLHKEDLAFAYVHPSTRSYK